MTTPNTRLRAVRMSLLMSQDDLARAIREAGEKVGQPNDASKRLVQRWESGTTTVPRQVYARALEAVTGLPIESLGFDMPHVSDDGQGGHDLDSRPLGAQSPSTAPYLRGALSGVWLSAYEFVSSSRGGEVFTGRHYVVLMQHGDRITARSLPNAASNAGSSVTLDLTLDGSTVTGTWEELTSPDGYYQGARYHGAIQMLVEPTGRRMTGKWVGFGRDFDVNTGPWQLKLVDPSTAKSTLDSYSRAPE